MKNPTLKYHFICKKCRQQVKADINFSSKRRFLNDPRAALLELRCSKCGSKDQYHVNRIYARPKVFVLSLVWLLTISTSVLLGKYMFDTYWRDSALIQDKSLMVLAFGAVLPLGVGGMIAYRISIAGNHFNERILE